MGNMDNTSAEWALSIYAMQYAKEALLIDNSNEVLHHLFRWTGFVVSIDKTMNEFKGRLKQTFWIKNKPVKEGYNSWAIYFAVTYFF